MKSLPAIFLLVAVAMAPSALSSDSICAKVRIEISQEFAFERQAFEARMTIDNGLPQTAISDIAVALSFTTADGTSVSYTTDPNDESGEHMFFVRLETDPLPDSIPSGSKETLRWLFIPSAGAAGDEPLGRLYFAGATLSYTALARTEIIEVHPDSIFVKPMPLLAIDYFLPFEVFGDDPMTPQIEPIEPFDLGLRVLNAGAGATRGFTITSGQPRIVENERDLDISFAITGAAVNDSPAAPRLHLPIGDLPPASATVVRWIMEASLYGRIVGFDATFSHADELGGRVTSLIQHVRTHRLLGLVMVDLEGRDRIRDFLAWSQEGPLTVFESNGFTSSIPEASIFPDLALSGSGHRRWLVPSSSPDPFSPFLYLSAPLPSSLPPTIRRVLRSDGKVLHHSNAWVSKSRPSPGVLSHAVHVFDATTTSNPSYEIEFGSPLIPNRPPNFEPLRSFATPPGLPISFSVSATDPDGPLPSVSAFGALPAGASFSPGDGSGTFAWTPSASQLGSYVLTFRAYDGLAETLASMVITVTDRPLIEEWKDRWFGSETDPAIIGNLADPDHDTLDNLLEYALDLDPTSSSVHLKPAIGKVVIDGLTYLTLSYTHRTDDPALLLQVVAADDVALPLPDWQPQSLEIPQPQDGLPPMMRRVTIRDSIALEDAGFRFLRLRVALEDHP